MKDLLEGATFQRDMLIEYLHIIQDNDKHLSAEKLLLHRLDENFMAEVWEVASDDHFDLVKEGQDAPAKRTIVFAHHYPV